MSSELAQWTLGKLVSSAIPPDLTERKKIVRLGLPRIIRLKRKRSRTRLQLVLCDDWHGNTGCLVAQVLAVLTKVRTLIHEEISLLTVLKFPFRERTPKMANRLTMFY